MNKEILEILETVQEAIFYIEDNVEIGNFNPTYTVMKDVLSAMEAIDNTLDKKGTDLNKYQSLFDDFVDNFDKLLDVYEQKNPQMAVEYMKENVTKKFLELKKEIELL